MPSQFRVPTRNVRGTITDFRIQYGCSVHLQEQNSGNIWFISTSACLCLWCTQYYPTSICGHDTMVLAVQYTAFYAFLIDWYCSKRVNTSIGFSTSVLEHGPLGCDNMISQSISMYFTNWLIHTTSLVRFL